MKYEELFPMHGDETPGERDPQKPRYSSSPWPYYDDNTARDKSELEHFSTAEGMKQGLIFREPVKQ